MGDFRIPPISTLVGSSLGNFFRVLGTGRVEPAYYHKVLLSLLVCLVTNGFIPWERLREKYRATVVQKPVFILGHWRSGTTLLHNLLCQDPRASFITTYQSLFPHNMYSKWLFKNFVHWKIPETRPTDNVRLGANLPQEDDFAMANITPSFYDFFFFPEDYRKFYARHVLFSENQESNKRRWGRAYDYLVKKALVNRPGEYPVLKNPANTARTGAIIEKYPDARFIHICRNPVDVYLSTKSFFHSLLPSVQLQATTHEQIRELIFDLYPMIMQEYLANRHKIPAKQLFELKFEEFEKEPLRFIEEIYKQFAINNDDNAFTRMQAYHKTLKGYRKSSYQISREELERISTDWSFAFEAFNYDLPGKLEIVAS